MLTFLLSQSLPSVVLRDKGLAAVIYVIKEQEKSAAV